MNIIEVVFYAICIVLLFMIIWKYFNAETKTETFIKTGAGKLEALHELRTRLNRRPVENFTMGLILGEDLDVGRNVGEVFNLLTETLIGVAAAHVDGEEFMVRRAHDMQEIIPEDFVMQDALMANFHNLARALDENLSRCSRSFIRSVKGLSSGVGDMGVFPHVGRYARRCV